MRYLIFTPEHPPFFSPYFDAENFFAEGMTVIDLLKMTFSTDGKKWVEIETDHL